MNLRLCLCIGIVAAITACTNAPRDNPLDPLSSSYQGGASIHGTVYVLNQNSPIYQARVTCLERGISVQTDVNGNYGFEKLDAGSLTLVCTKDNFTPDTQRTVLEAGTSRQILFGLNGAPVVISQKIVTRKIDQYYPSPQYFADVSASVTDPNGITDVDSVWFVVDTLKFVLSYSPTTKLFQTTIFKYDLPSNTIQWLVGKPLTILSQDRLGARNISSPFYVTRVIENGATPTYPSSLNNDTTGSRPLLQWSPPSVTFSYTYDLSISRVDAGIETVVWTYVGLNSVNEQLQFPADGSGLQLQPPGNYVWTISVVDEFGNLYRSKESSFIVR